MVNVGQLQRGVCYKSSDGTPLGTFNGLDPNGLPTFIENRNPPTSYETCSAGTQPQQQEPNSQRYKLIIKDTFFTDRLFGKGRVRPDRITFPVKEYVTRADIKKINQPTVSVDAADIYDLVTSEGRVTLTRGVLPGPLQATVKNETKTIKDAEISLNEKEQTALITDGKTDTTLNRMRNLIYTPSPPPSSPPPRDYGLTVGGRRRKRSTKRRARRTVKRRATKSRR